jgi:hypothetical protein
VSSLLRLQLAQQTTTFPVAAPGPARFLSTDVSGGKGVSHPGQFTRESFLGALVSFFCSQHLTPLASSTDLVYGPDKAKVPLPTASPEEVFGWALRTVGVSQRNADKLLEQEIDGADIVHLSKLPESEIKAELLAANLSLSAALKLSVAISDFGAAATGTRALLRISLSHQSSLILKHPKPTRVFQLNQLLNLQLLLIQLGHSSATFSTASPYTLGR